MLNEDSYWAYNLSEEMLHHDYFNREIGFKVETHVNSSSAVIRTELCEITTSTDLQDIYYCVCPQSISSFSVKTESCQSFQFRSTDYLIAQDIFHLVWACIFFIENSN